MFYPVIFITLGAKCNFSCKYCMQHHLSYDTPEDVNINPDLINFLLDGKQDDTKTSHIMLWGGEPLVYWDQAKELVEKLAQTGKFTFGMVTNGSLLDDEKVDFINKYNIVVAVSHDGSVTEYTRNIDVFKDKRILELFNKINSRGISAVMSSVNADFYKIWDYFDETFKSRYINVNVDLIYDTCPCRELTEIDEDKYELAMEKLFSRAYTKLCNKESQSREYQELSRHIETLTHYVKNIPEISEPRCGTMSTMLNTDLQGNVYMCHNSPIIIGNISDSYFTLRDRFQQYNKYVRTDECQDCNALPLCAGGCILLDENGHKKYCRLKKIYYGKFLELIMKFKDT